MLECFHITEYKLVFISLLLEIILTNINDPSALQYRTSSISLVFSGELEILI